MTNLEVSPLLTVIVTSRNALILDTNIFTASLENKLSSADVKISASRSRLTEAMDRISKRRSRNQVYYQKFQE